MDSVKEYKCLNCKAGLEFYPPNQNWKCLYCFNEYSKEQLDAVDSINEPSKKKLPELDSYRCNSCGAELIVDSIISATFCLYCKNHSIIKTRFAGEFKPNSLIPFKFTKEQAKEIYKKWISKRLFAPNEFKQKEEVEKITGIYTPFWLFDCKVDGMIEGEGTKENSWSDGNYQYTQTKYFRVIRGGNAEYNKVPIDASKKLDDKFMHMIEPYNYEDLKDFSMEYLSGFMAEKYDVEALEAENVMKERVHGYLEERLLDTVAGYTSFNVVDKQIQLTNSNQKYAMLPIYLLINKYKGKGHIFIVNGQTGKVVGDTPISRLKQMLFAGSLLVASLLLLVLAVPLFIIAIIISIVVFINVTLKNKGKITINNLTYEENGSFNLSDEREEFIRESTSRTKIETQSNSSSSSGSNSSSTHTSSSGRSHGGGGGKF